MPVSSELHILVPGICGPLAEIQSLKNSETLNRWINILEKSKKASSQHTTNDVLTSIFNLNVKNNFPSAALTLLANRKYDQTRHYMHADPVHLQADMDHAVLTSSKDLNISESESKALCDLLNQHFNQDGLEFITLNNHQWFVSSENKICMDTTPLAEAVGRNINFILPKGGDASHWKKVLTEAQMLMHSHATNTTRENTAQLTINSLWFHGSGELADIAVAEANARHVSRVCSNDSMLKGLAAQLNCDYQPVPALVNEYVEALLAGKKFSVNVLHLSSLEHLVNYTDVTLWLDELDELLEHWIYPLLKVAHKNNIKVTLYPCNQTLYQFSRYDFLRFWHHNGRKSNLEKHVNSY